MVGQKFGRLRVISDTARSKYWLCRCRCGNEKEIRKDHLIHEKVRSCGCLNSELSSKRTAALHLSNTKTGLSKQPVYQTWCGMRQRCNNPNSKAYADYGGRGIRVCDRWNESFKNFFADMGCPPKGWTLDRIDNNGDYSPENCRWATRKTQLNNTRANRLITFNGQTRNLRQWSEATGIAYNTIRERLERSRWTVEQALTTPAGATGCRKPA